VVLADKNARMGGVYAWKFEKVELLERLSKSSWLKKCLCINPSCPMEWKDTSVSHSDL
jgi:hypothetical protein